MTATRIYIVGPWPTQEAQPAENLQEGFRLVEAATSAQAIRHVASRYKAEVATTRQVADLVTSGIKVEVAGDDLMFAEVEANK